MLHEPNKTNNHSRSFSLFQNLHMLKKKIRFISKKDTNQFLIWEKFKSASKEDANPFILKKKSNTSKKDVDLLFLLRKIQIYI